eukprot:scaffold13551_cov54-Phaeocystis_antarctica.AAC.2
MVPPRALLNNRGSPRRALGATVCVHSLRRAPRQAQVSMSASDAGQEALWISSSTSGAIEESEIRVAPAWLIFAPFFGSRTGSTRTARDTLTKPDLKAPGPTPRRSIANAAWNGETPGSYAAFSS